MASRWPAKTVYDPGIEIRGEKTSCRLNEPQASQKKPVRYCAKTDTMAIEIRPWPGRDDETTRSGADAAMIW